jgi:hypothetical protein
VYYLIDTGNFQGGRIAGRVLAAWTTLALAIGDARGRRKRAARTRVRARGTVIVESEGMFMRAELVPVESVTRTFTAEGEPIELWFSPREPFSSATMPGGAGAR